jgi:hypothetical protein
MAIERDRGPYAIILGGKKVIPHFPSCENKFFYSPFHGVVCRMAIKIFQSPYVIGGMLDGDPFFLVTIRYTHIIQWQLYFFSRPQRHGGKGM